MPIAYKPARMRFIEGFFRFLPHNRQRFTSFFILQKLSKHISFSFFLAIGTVHRLVYQAVCQPKENKLTHLLGRKLKIC